MLIRPVGAPVATSGRGRIVFSSSGTPTRETEASDLVGPGSLTASVVSGISGLAAALFATLFPSDCRLCGAPLINISRLPVCEECLEAVCPISDGLCSICGERLVSPYAFSQDQGVAVCGLCRRLAPPYEKAAAYGSYESGLRELIHLLKYDGVRPAANVLGRMLSDAIAVLEPHFAGARILVVPVPLHSRKLRQRGFNQSELIARVALKLKVDPQHFELHSGILERRRETMSQIGLSSHQRRENMRGAFGVLKPEAVKGNTILLVDDVFTTGTTLSECARVLRRAGASKVYVATVARTLKAEAAKLQLTTEEVEPGHAMAAHG